MLDRQHSAKLTKAGPQMIRVNYDGVISIPEGRGLLLRLDSNSGNAFLEAVEDHHAPTIHPNCYIPDSFSKLRFLQGGGSGAAVFAGSHPVLNNCVMKHASCKDTREVLSLAEIGNELKRRDPIAAKYLRERIPEFAFFYVSPFHVRDRSKELCATMRHDTCQKLMLRQDSSTDRPDESDSSEEDEQTENGFSMRKRSNHVGQVKRNLQLHRGEPLGLETFFTKVMFHIPSCTDEGLIPDGHEFLSRFVDHLEAAQQDNYWKITVGQKAIGGPTSNNGAFVLTSGRLKGALLEKTIEEYTTVLRNLRALTLPEEKNILQQVRDEVQQLEQIGNVESISKACDQFVGSAIRKNFHPFKGRFAIMREIGENIRDGSLVFTQRETVPAEILGRLLEKGNSLSSIFSHSPRFPCALDKVEGSWLDLLQTATSFEDTVLTDRIWTCGLTDAGLHNAFICLKRGLELFDLGKPQLVPEPAFLTKFLMSFFHAFGMEDNGRGNWVHRFEVVRQSDALCKLKLTHETERKLSTAYDGFEFAVQSFVDSLFHQNPEALKLMVRYSVLQLVSDAGFCLQRWQSKGGGGERFGYNARQDLSKWLWRSIWDLYIASEVCDRFSNLSAPQDP